MPTKDPNNYTLLSYLAFVGVAFWGGLVAHIQHIRRHNKPFLWREAFLQILISGFAGMLASLLCWHIQAPAPLVGFMSGMAGFMGSRALELFERKFTKTVGE
ncbi:TPA: phage holin family protein [Photobacterium damselae]